MNRSETIRKRKEKVLLFLFGLYVILFLLSNILSVKIVDFKFFETSFSILLVPFLFLITDIVCEVFDYEKSKNFYFFSIIFLFLSSIIIFTALKLPLASRAFISQEQFEAVFKQTIRIFLASIIAFSISQLNDIFIFSN